MSFGNLPSEPLQKIFHYLQLNDIDTCRAVCKTWESVANDTAEQKWKKLCKTEFGAVCDEAFYKSCLSWQELYKSLRLWPQVKSAKIFIHYSEQLDGDIGYVPLDSRESKQIQIIKNGVIGYPRYIRRGDESEKYGMGRYGSCNAVCYYDPETLCEIERQIYNFRFHVYEENEDLIVLRGDHLNLYVVTKMNNKIHNAGEMVQYEWGDYSKFYLVRNKVFFITKDYKILMSKLVYENGEATINTTPFVAFDLFPALNSIHSIAYINENQINLLTCRGRIYSAVDQQLHELCHVKKKMDNRNQVVNMLKQHGFDWSTPAVYRWISQRDIIKGDWVEITHLKNAVVHSHGCVVFIGTSRRTLHIYYNPYQNGQLKLYNRKPTLKIDLNEHVPYHSEEDDYGFDTVSSSQRQILSINVMEIENGHRIIMLYCQRLVAIELRHDPPKRPGESLDHDHLAAKRRCNSYFRIA